MSQAKKTEKKPSAVKSVSSAQKAKGPPQSKPSTTTKSAVPASLKNKPKPGSGKKSLPANTASKPVAKSNLKAVPSPKPTASKTQPQKVVSGSVKKTPAKTVQPQKTVNPKAAAKPTGKSSSKPATPVKTSSAKPVSQPVKKARTKTVQPQKKDSSKTAVKPTGKSSSKPATPVKTSSAKPVAQPVKKVPAKTVQSQKTAPAKAAAKPTAKSSSKPTTQVKASSAKPVVQPVEKTVVKTVQPQKTASSKTAVKPVAKETGKAVPPTKSASSSAGKKPEKEAAKPPITTVDKKSADKGKKGSAPSSSGVKEKIAVKSPLPPMKAHDKKKHPSAGSEPDDSQFDEAQQDSKDDNDSDEPIFPPNEFDDDISKILSGDTPRESAEEEEEEEEERGPRGKVDPHAPLTAANRKKALLRSEETAPVSKNDTMKVYMQDIGQISLVSKEQEVELAAKIHGNDQRQRDDARATLIKANLRLVVKIAHDFKGLGLPLLDLISEGNIGLMRAVEKFDPQKGAKFSSYAAWWIKQSMRRALANQSRTIRIPVQSAGKINKIKSVRMKLAEELGREPSDAEIAQHLDFSERTVAGLRLADLRTFSLHDPIQQGEDGEFQDIIPDRGATTPDRILGDVESVDRLKDLLKDLEDREREILELRFGLDNNKPKTLEEVSQRIQRTRERVRQIQNQALKKLREKLIDEAGFAQD